MPNPPPAPRREPPGRYNASRRLATTPAMDSSDDVKMLLMGSQNGVEGDHLSASEASASFTFGLRAAHGIVAGRDPLKTERLMLSSSSSSSSYSSRAAMKGEDDLLKRLRGGAGGACRSPAPNRNLTSIAPFSLDSPFASSPGLDRRKGIAMPPATPTGTAARGVGHSSVTGWNHDGSFSVVRDEDEANNSGLLDLGPLGPLTSMLSRGTDHIASKAMGWTKGPGKNAKVRTARDWGRDGAGHRPASDDVSVGDHHSSRHNGRAEVDGSIIEHSLSDVLESDEMDENEDTRQLLSRLRLWRQDAMEHHLFETAIFWGEKVLWLEQDEGQRPNDAYFLAKAYFLSHQYSRAQHLLTTPLPLVASASASTNKDQAKTTRKSPCIQESVKPTEEDALHAALAGTQQSCILPKSMFSQHHSPQKNALGHSHGDEHEELATTAVTGTGPRTSSTCGHRKRKDRDFTVSRTGTASENNDGIDIDGQSSVDGHIDNETASAIDEEGNPLFKPAKPQQAGFQCSRSEPLYVDGDALPLPRKVYDAWIEEQQRSLAEVKEASRKHGDVAHSQHNKGTKALVDISAACRFLAAKCFTRLGKFAEALDLVGEESGRWKGGGKYGYAAPSSDGLLKVSSSVSHLRGLIHLRMDNTDQAREAFIEALSLDVKNYDAFAALVDGKLLESKGQLWSLMEGLQWQAQSAGDAMAFDFIKTCYIARLEKENHENAVRAAAARRALWDEFPSLQKSADLLMSLAEDLYARRRYRDAFAVTSRILTLDPDNEPAIDLSVGCTASSPSLQRSERPKLFLLANRLVEEHPDRASSWYAVGVWYSTSGRWTEARRYFSKATLLQPRHLPSWLSFAHSFSLEGESEQAVLAYSSVLRTFPDIAHVKVCVGSEHLRMGNLHLARLFLEGQADVEVYSEGDEERGVLCYLDGRTNDAIRYFERALRASEAVGEPQATWFTSRMNLGWAYMKANRLGDAQRMFSNAVSLDSTKASACLGLGMVLHRRGELSKAVEWYHETLGIDPAHVQATELLQHALDEYATGSTIQETSPLLAELSPSTALKGQGANRSDAATGLGKRVVSLTLDGTNRSENEDLASRCPDQEHQSEHNVNTTSNSLAVSSSLMSASYSGMMAETRPIDEEVSGDVRASDFRGGDSLEMDETE